MTYKKDDTNPTMFRATALTANHFAVVQAFITQIGKPIATIKELETATFELTGKAYCPWFIYRNLALRTKDHTFDLSRVKLAKGETATTLEAMAAEVAVPKVKKPAKKAKPVKKENSKGKPGKKTKAPKVPEPVEASSEVEVPATEFVTA
jgi:hypothetical protein